MMVRIRDGKKNLKKRKHKRHSHQNVLHHYLHAKISTIHLFILEKQ